MYHILWQTQALTQFSELLYYLDTTYSPAVGEQLLNEVNRKVALLQSNPFIYRKTNRKAHVRRCLVNNHTVFYYQVNKFKKTVRLLAFWDSRRNPGQSLQ
jgi:plasmid stabilization system protein ParE